MKKIFYDDNQDKIQMINNYLKNNDFTEESIYFLDLGEIEDLFQLWINKFNNIKPYYAIKCNPDNNFIKKLAYLGANFDCASIDEIDKIIDLDIDTSRIIYANPCKRKKDIIDAYNKGVRITTFDNEIELEKIAQVAPNMNCILRIYAKDSDAKCQFAHKFGCPKEYWIPILEKAKELNIKIIGISFHVGSGAFSGKPYENAIKDASEFRKIAEDNYNQQISILDIGGGFTSHNLKDIPEIIHNAIDNYFGNSNIKIIAEPGRFFAETSGYLATNIIGIRKTENTRDYWITDSLYGSFNCIFYDHYIPIPEIFENSNKKFKTILYGPTCDGLDKIMELEEFPEMSLNQWILFKNMGAYTLAAACNFNGIPFLNTKIIYLYKDNDEINSLSFSSSSSNS